MPTSDQFRALARRLGFAAFDAMVVADGSGSTADKPCGFYATAYVAEPGLLFDAFGSAGHGSNQYAEVRALLEGLRGLEDRLGAALAGMRVLCVSDSEWAVRSARGEYARGAHPALWAALRHYEQDLRLDLFWQWIPRESDPLQVRCDRGARRLRTLLRDALPDLD